MLSNTNNYILQRPPVTFFVDDVEPGTTYRVILYSANAKGRSEAIVLDEISFKGVAKYTSSKYNLNIFFSFFNRTRGHTR